MALLTPKQLEQLRQIISDASTAVAISTVGHEVTDVELQRLVDEGWVDPGHIDDVILTGFQYGNLLSKLPAAANMDLGQFIRTLQANPIKLSEAERHAVRFAQDRAGQYCVGLGSRYSEQAGRLVVEADEALAQQTRDIIRREVSRTVAERQTRGQLASDLGNLTEDWARDWRRIANTEVHTAQQTGYLEDVRERYGDEELLAKVPEPNACKDCKRLYLDADGQPIVRPASWWAEQGTNVGLKRQDWKPVLGAMHPWCQCRLIRIPKGWKLKGDFPAWDLVPEGAEETGKAVDFANPAKSTEEPVEKARKLHARRKFQGFDISIENRAGSVRHTKTAGATKMVHPYGYIRLTEGTDGDHVDVFLGPDEQAKNVYVVHQMKAPDFKVFDEDKVLLGMKSAADAKAAYLKHFDDPRFFGSMDVFPVEEFRKKVYARKRKMIKAQEARKPNGQYDRGAARTAGANVRDDKQKVRADWPPLQDSPRKNKVRKLKPVADATDPELAGVDLDHLVAAAERFDVRGLRQGYDWANGPRLDRVEELQEPVERTDTGKKNLEHVEEIKRQRQKTAVGMKLTLNPKLIRREQKR